MNAFYIVPAGVKKSVYNLFSTHPPMEKRIEALSRLEAQLQGARRVRRVGMGFLDALLGRRKVKGAGARPAVRDHDRLRRRSRPQQGIKTRGAAGDRLPAAGDRRLPARSSPTWRRSVARHRRGDRHDGRDQRRRVRLPLDDPARPRHRGPRRSASTRSATRWPSAATATACWPPSSPSRTRPGKPLYLIYNYKRGTLVPVRARPPGDKQRDTERELQIKAPVGTELPFEPELERWFPLWGIPI